MLTGKWKIAVSLIILCMPALAAPSGVCLSEQETVNLARKIKQMKAELEMEKERNARLEKCIREHVDKMRPVLSCFTVVKDGQHMKEEGES